MRTRVTLILAFLLPLFLATGPIIFEDRLATPSHQDPAAATPSLDYSYAMLFADGAWSAFLSKDWTQVRELKSVLPEVNLPQNMRLVLTRLSNILEELGGVLRSLETALEDGSNLLAENRLTEAGAKLETAQDLIRQGERLSDELDTAIERVGIMAAASAIPAAEQRAQLQAHRARWKEIWQAYLSRLAMLREKTQEMEHTGIATELTLTPSQPSAMVGEALAVSGQLATKPDESSTLGLPGRFIHLSLGKSYLASLATASDGTFQGTVPIPLLYKPTALLEARFVPEDDDKAEFLASYAAAEIGLVFFETMLELEAPAAVHPGRPFSIAMRIGPAEPPQEGRNIKVLLRGQPIAKFLCREACQSTVTLPPDTPLGEQLLSVIVEPWGPFAEARQDLALQVSKLPTTIDVKAPLWAIVPGKLEVRGVSYSPLGSLEGEQVTASLGDISAATSARGGSYAVTLDLPILLTAVGFQTLEVVAEPQEPWYESSRNTSTVFVVNLGNLSLMLLAVALGVMVLFARRRGQEVAVVSLVPPTEDVIPAPEPEVPGGPGGIILGAYYRALRLIEMIVTMKQKPSSTLREFLATVRPNLGSSFQPFSRLTGLAEQILYSPRMPRPADAQEAEELAAKVGERGTNAQS